MKLQSGEFSRVVAAVSKLCGLALGPEKEYLVETRLAPVCSRHGISSFDALARQMVASPQSAVAREAVDAITTHETSFFRDASAFDALQHKALPELLDRRKASKRVRIWCAACSTGQEPYSVSMAVNELLGPRADAWDIEILASDISGATVARAETGLYSEMEIGRSTRPELLQKYTVRADSGWRITDRVRALVRYESRNLLEPLRGLGPFDLVFCRNVSIYFERDVRRDLFVRIHSLLASDGLLFVGGAESLAELDEYYDVQHHCRSHFYVPK